MPDIPAPITAIFFGREEVNSKGTNLISIYCYFYSYASTSLSDQ